MQSYLASTWKKDSVLIPKPTCWCISLTYRSNKQKGLQLRAAPTPPTQWAMLVAQSRFLQSHCLPASPKEKRKKLFFSKSWGMDQSICLSWVPSMASFPLIFFFSEPTFRDTRVVLLHAWKPCYTIILDRQQASRPLPVSNKVNGFCITFYSARNTFRDVIVHGDAYYHARMTWFLSLRSSMALAYLTCTILRPI